MHLRFCKWALMELDLYVYISIVNTRTWFYTKVVFTIETQTFGNSRPSREPHGPPEGRLFNGTVPHVSTYMAGRWLWYG
jgi:hypothetical protein